MGISETLAGGDPRSLGRTGEVVKLVMGNQALLNELFECIFNSDEIVRMRASDALEKVCHDKPQWLEPYKARLLNEVPSIKQPSVQWHLAQMLSEITLNESEEQRAIKVMQHNLNTMDDWIVVNLTLESLAKFARKGSLSRGDLIKILRKHQASQHKSVASRCDKLLKEFAET